jgi:arginyl-tRNA synthetase
MLIREKIKKDLVETLDKIGVKTKEVVVEKTADPKNGDYSSNVALQQYKTTQAKVWQSPLKFAKDLTDNFPRVDYLEKIEVAPPGFINFFLSKDYLQREVAKIFSQKEDYAKLGLGSGKKAQIEFISANPTGPLTLGNGRGGFLGDALSNILSCVGYEVEREYYINDYGSQIKILGMSLAWAEGKLGKVPQDLQLYQGDYIKKIAKKLSLKKVNWQDFDRLGKAGAKVILEEYIKPTVKKKMKIFFDNWFSEYRELHQKGLIKKGLEELEAKRLSYQKEGAIWFKTSKFEKSRDHVLVKSDGELTYHLTDIFYHKNKFERGFEKVIDIWGADHLGHLPLVYGAVKALGIPDDWLSIIIVQLVRVVEKGKPIRLSKRRGAIVTIEDLLSQVPLDVARFFFLARPADTHLDFDLSLARERSEKNPVYYIQYAHARICSILRKAGGRLKVKGERKNLHLTPKTVHLLNHPAELALIKKLIQLPELIEDIAKNYQVHALCFYLLELADLWHKFYEQCKVLSKDNNLTQARLQLTKASAIILQTSLGFLGISAPERM